MTPRVSAAGASAGAPKFGFISKSKRPHLIHTYCYPDIFQSSLQKNVQ